MKNLFNGHKDVRQDDSALDFGGPGITWCEYCGAIYNSLKWNLECKKDTEDICPAEV